MAYDDDGTQSETLDKLMDAVTKKLEDFKVEALLLMPDSSHDGNSDYEELRDEFEVILEQHRNYKTNDILIQQETFLNIKSLLFELKDKLFELGEEDTLKYIDSQPNYEGLLELDFKRKEQE